MMGRWAAPLSALVLILSFPVFPHFQLWPLAWIGLVPLLIQLQTAGWKKGMLLGAAFGYPFMVGVLAWVKWFGAAPWLALCFFEGAWFMGFTLLVSLLAPLWCTARPTQEQPRSWIQHLAAVLLPACAWILIEWMRSLGRLSIPWGNLSHTQVELAPLVSTARWWGAYGVTLLIVMVNSSAANWIISRGADRRRATLILGATIAVIAASCWVSVRTLDAPTRAPLKIALLQGNITRESTATVHLDSLAFREKALGIYTGLSQKAAAEHPDIVVWPETAIPGPLILDPGLLETVRKTARETGAYLVVGSPHFVSEGAYNATFVVSPSGQVLGRYDKQHLVPFGEYTPFWRTFFARYGAPQVDLLRGQGHLPVSTPLGKLGIMICYESMFPQIARQTTLNGADLLMVVTNDQWFGPSSAPYDHAANAPFRAAETGRWIVEAGTTGISLFAEPGGHCYEATKMFTQAVDVHIAYPRTGLTLYTRLGDWPPLLSILVLVAALGTRGFRLEKSIKQPS